MTIPTWALVVWLAVTVLGTVASVLDYYEGRHARRMDRINRRAYRRVRKAERDGRYRLEDKR